MTRAKAMAVLAGGEDIDFVTLDTVFRAFGFESYTPSFETEVYFHPRFKQCGAFPARDDGVHVLTPLQRALAIGLINCVLTHEGAAT